MTTPTMPQTPQWSLVALSPQLGELSVPLGVSTSVGRHQDNDIVLATQQISRQHAKFNQIGSSLVVQDLGSSNGTFVNGERIGTDAVELNTDDEVAFADILFVVANFVVADETLNKAEDIPETVTEIVPLSATIVPTTANIDSMAVTQSVAQTTDTAPTKLSSELLTETPTAELTPKSQPVPDIKSDITSEIKTELVTTEPEIVKSDTKPTETITPISSTPAAVTPTNNTLAEQSLAPLTAPSPTTPIVPKKAPAQTWLVAIVIVILIVLAIIGTLFLK